METPNIPYKQANIYEIMKITLIDFTHLPSLKKKSNSFQFAKELISQIYNICVGIT